MKTPLIDQSSETTVVACTRCTWRRVTTPPALLSALGAYKGHAIMVHNDRPGELYAASRPNRL